MSDTDSPSQVRLARCAGLSLLASIIIGILASVFITQGIDINLSADIEATATNMLDAGQRLRATAYIGVLGLGLELLFVTALFLLLRDAGQLIAAWSLLLAFSAALISLLGAVFAMNAAEIASNPAYLSMASDSQRLLFAGLQATSDYTSFHLSLVISSVAKAGFFYLFLRSRFMPVVISGWGLFASLFVAVTIVARDFIPMLGSTGVTLAFMVSNLIALLATGLYLAIKGVRKA